MASITVPEDLYVRLAAEAQRKGLTLDALLASLLAEQERPEAIASDINSTVGAEYDPATDPLMRLAGSIRSGDSSWGERHDEYLAEAYWDSHDGE